MTRYINLDKKDIKVLIRDLNNLKREMQKLPEIIDEELLTQAESMIMNDVETSFKDGNIDMRVETSQNKVSLVGSQVVYFEYGTGYTGKTGDSSPHMADIGYTHSNRKEWTYKSKISGKRMLSKGLKANMPVFKTSMYINRTKRDTVKKRVKEVLKKNDFY